LVRDYLRKLELKLRDIEHLIDKKEIEIEIISEELATVRGKLYFIDNSVLDFMELISSDDSNYRFHWMDNKNRLICRWDSAPHHNVESFPYHKHTRNGVKSSEKVRLINVLKEIEEIFMRQ